MMHTETIRKLPKLQTINKHLNLKTLLALRPRSTDPSHTSLPALPQHMLGDSEGSSREGWD